MFWSQEDRTLGTRLHIQSTMRSALLVPDTAQVKTKGACQTSWDSLGGSDGSFDLLQDWFEKN